MIHRRSVFYTLLSMLVLLLASGPVMAASLKAVIDRNHVEFGQSVNLTVTATELNGEIDFSVLEGDFDILDSRTSRNVRIVNGKSDSSLVWQIGLMPLKVGELTIPSFNIDAVASTELVLTVGEARLAKQGVPAGEDFFLELSTDKTEAFVQEQIILTARVYQARSIIEGSLSDPVGDGLMLQRLGNDQTFTKSLNGRQYNVIERRYAIFAQESGEHTISPLRLIATVRQNNRSGSRSGFFTPTQKIHVASNSLVLSVKPKPAEGQSGWWLPAETLSLTANWEEDITQARVDEPLTRSISLAAQAVLSTQLPAFDVPEIDGAKVYPDLPDVQTQTDGESLITYRNDKWAIIPRAVGPLLIPEIRIEWYDTINNKLQYAVLPEEVIDIQPSENTSMVLDNNLTIKSPIETPQIKQITPAVAAPNEQMNTLADGLASKWKIAFYVVLFLWLLTLGWWFWLMKASKLAAKVKRSTMALSNKISVSDVEVACRSNNPERIVQALLNFSKKNWPDDAPLSIGDLSARLDDKPLTALLNALDKAVYGTSSEKSDFGNLVKVLNTALGASNSSEVLTGHKSLLPEL